MRRTVKQAPKKEADVMKTALQIGSIICFVAIIPSLVVVNWYFYGYGLLSMFTLVCIGLILDQIRRIAFPAFEIQDTIQYRRNKTIKLLSLILFVMSPMVFVYGNKFQNSFGTIAFFIIIGIGLIIDVLAQTFFPY